MYAVVNRATLSAAAAGTMSSDKSESESTLNGPVLVNGMEMEGAGRESPGVGVSGNKPMVNGDLRDVGDGGEADFVAVKTPLDGINNSTHEDAAVKVGDRESERGEVRVSLISVVTAADELAKRSLRWRSDVSIYNIPALGLIVIATP